MGRISLFLVLIIVAISSCAEQHDVAPKDYLAVVSLNITGGDETGATFEARADDIDKSTVLEHGFVWSLGNNPRLDNAEFVKLGADLNNDNFTTRINSRLRKNRKYYVRAFVQSDEHTFLSDTVSFQSFGSLGPTLTSFSPSIANLADTIVLESDGFSSSIQNNKVFFNDLEATIFKTEPDRLFVTVPQALDTEESTIRVEISGESSTYSTVFKLIVPLITNLSVDVIGLGELVEITPGNPIPEERDLLTVQLEYPDGTRIPVRSEDVALNPLRFRVPFTLGSSTFKVVLGYNNLESTSSQSIQLRAPSIDGFSESEVRYDEEIAILGKNFSPVSANNQVWLDGKEVEVTESGINSSNFGGSDFIRIKIPVSANNPYTSREIGVKIEVLGQEATSNSLINIVSPWFRLPDAPFDGKESVINTGTLGYIFSAEALWQFDGNDWSRLSTIPREPVRSPSSFLLNDELYLGLGNKLSSPLTNLQDFWKYSLSTGTWTQLSDFPAGVRTRAIHFTANGFGFVGVGSSGTSSSHNDFWKYNPVDDSWQQVADYPSHVNGGSAASTPNGVFSGFSSDNGNRIFKYDVQSDSWSESSRLPLSFAGFSHMRLVANNELVYAGVTSSGNRLFQYNTATQQWTGLTSCPIKGKLLFVSNGKVYMSGVFFGQANQVWEYDPSLE